MATKWTAKAARSTRARTGRGASKGKPKPLGKKGPSKAARSGMAPPRRNGSPVKKRPGKEEVLAHHATRMPARKVAAGDANPVALDIAQAGLDKKAEDVTVLDVRGLTSYADFFVIMTADSDRQASAIADHVEQTMKGKGVSKVGVEGYETGRWILVDYGDVVAHVMSRESREFYDLDGLWADAPRLRVEG